MESREHNPNGPYCWCGPVIISRVPGCVEIYHRDAIARAMDRTGSALGAYLMIWQREGVPNG